MLFVSGVFFNIFGYSDEGKGPIPFGPERLITYGTSYYGYALAGFLVGFGTKLSNGCTSGHGLCGLPRLSIRSIVAVMVFLLTGIGIATLNHYETLGFLTNEKYNPYTSINHTITANIFMALGLLLPIIAYFLEAKPANFRFSNYLKEYVTVFMVGLIFGLGLMISGMTRRSKIMNFLQISSNWDPSLLFVLGAGVTVNFITFNYMIHIRKHPVFGGQLFNPSNTTLDWKLLGGAFCFGLGWGIGCLCPGPFIMLYSVFTLQIQVVWGCCLVAGMYLANWLSNRTEAKQQESMPFFSPAG